MPSLYQDTYHTYVTFKHKVKETLCHSKTQSKSFFKTGGEQENSIFEYSYNICSEYLT